MLQATTGGQVVGFVHRSLESAETLLWQRSHTLAADRLSAWISRRGGRKTEGDADREEGEGGTGDGLWGKEVRNDPKFGLSGCQVVFRWLFSASGSEVLSDFLWLYLQYHDKNTRFKSVSKARVHAWTYAWNRVSCNIYYISLPRGAVKLNFSVEFQNQNWGQRSPKGQSWSKTLDIDVRGLFCHVKM